MTPADRIIVALDVPNQDAARIAKDIVRNTDVRFFKLSASNLLATPADPLHWDIMALLKNLGADVMLDLKVYDTPDSVRRIVGDAFAAGARFVTVHPDCVAPAQESLNKLAYDNRRVLPILELTSGGDTTFENKEFMFCLHATGGAAVCPPTRTAQVKAWWPESTLVCPGIRQTIGNDGDHASVWGPAAAVHAGADYLVIGRPITRAPDPVAAVREIIVELERNA